eukprot:comp22712_c0_seq1/m.35267 comp22712_c0_seq1/g.35267  ORF comp22712_c0_seq1/g.35267 comp22712_c0_seq1/m.35267 type:complete len:659 (-) comp22712_c0_seq1:615-2591(-)
MSALQVSALARAARPALAIRAVGLASMHYRGKSTALPWDDVYIQKSVIPSFSFQASMPRLPVPTLDETLKRYVDSIEPLCTPEEFALAKNLANEFKDGPGKALQEELVAFNKSNKNTSYITKAWFDMYLEGRYPLPANSNPYIAWHMDPNPAKNSQDIRTAILVRSSLRFYKSLKAGLLKPDLYHMNPKKTDNDKFLSRAKWIPSPLRWVYAYMNGVFPLDMSQYGRLFQSTRIPRKGKDELFTDNSARHVAVMRRNRVYTFDVLKEDGGIVSTEEVLANIRGVLADNRPPEQFALGALTTDDRDAWAEARTSLEQDPTNAHSLKALDSALFLVVLDDHSKGENDLPGLNGQLLLGDGRNRWYDKSFSMIVLPDGMAAVNFEHAWGDGISVLRYINEVYADSKEAPLPKPAQAVTPTELKFNLTPDVKLAIDKSAKRFDDDTGRLHFRIGHTDGFGKEALKKHNAEFGNDGLCQFAFQLAHLRLYGKTASTYESCSTAAFKHGRTETIRPNTVETLAAAKTFLDPKATREEKLGKLKAANKKHSELTKNAATGKGFDRHLFMLKLLASKSGQPLPKFFTEGGLYDRMGHIILSTSTLQSPAIKSGGFGPVTHDGFGLGYSLMDDHLGLSVSHYHGKADELFDGISESWADIANVLENK